MVDAIHPKIRRLQSINFSAKKAGSFQISCSVKLWICNCNQPIYRSFLFIIPTSLICMISEICNELYLNTD